MAALAPTAPAHASPVDNVIADLLQAGAITAAAVERARRGAEVSKERVDLVLMKLGLVDERAAAGAWSRCLDLPIAEPTEFPEQPLLGDQLSGRFLRHAGILPLSHDDQGLRIAVLDPLDQFAPRAIAARTGLPVVVSLTTPSQILAAFNRLYPDGAADAEAPDTTNADVVAGDLARLRDLATDAPAIRFIDTVIERAVELNASDVHLATSRSGPRLRLRIDGVLRDVPPPPADLHAAIVSRLKVLADLDIAESRVPQDGRIRYGVGGREIDLRVATMPHLDGEGAVLRILDRSSVKPDIPGLGFSGQVEAALNLLLREPHGIFLVTGPTGSGKTTTLYAALQQLVRPERNVLSVEDPVEYYLDGVAQIQVQRKIGLDFPTVLRAILRQDPDVIMIGEIRDGETATIANQAALTGHFVLATLHTNSAAASIPRLIDMGLEPYLLASTLRGVLSQRLVRRLCRHCRRPPDSAGRSNVARLLHLAPSLEAEIGTATIHEAVGCEHCNWTGFRGRMAVSEMLLVSEALRTGILDRADARHLEAVARSEGTAPLVVDGARRVVSGDTTLNELLRVVGDGGAA